MGYFYALVVNPRNGELFQALQSDRDNQDFLLHDMGNGFVGEGYFQGKGRSEYTTCEETTSYPRVHTPGGVTRKGTGLGTCLYTGLAVAAAHNQTDNGDWLEIKVAVDGAGVGSNAHRSKEAAKWWDQAVNKFSIARRKYNAVYEDDEFCDVYSYRSAVHNHLVVAIEQADELPEDLLPENRPRNVYEVPRGGLRLVDKEALAGVNMGSLRDMIGRRLSEERASLLAAELLRLGLTAKLPQTTLERMVRQYSAGFDESIVPEYVRRNPTMKTKIKSVPKIYKHKGTRSNPAPTKEQIKADVKALREQREKNGWNKFITND